MTLPPPPVELIEVRTIGSRRGVDGAMVVDMVFALRWRRYASLRWITRCYFARARELGISLWDPWFLWCLTRNLARLVWAG